MDLFHKKYFVVLCLVLVCYMWVAGAAALPHTQYVVINNASNEAGGQIFEQVVGSRKARHILSSASHFIQQTFYAANAASYPQKEVDKVTLYVDDVPSDGAAAITEGDASSANASEIHLLETYVGTYSLGDLATEIRGVLYHEMTHVWQWNGQGTADGGLIEGIADYVRLTAGLAAPTWGPPGGGDSWNEGYSVTAYFLQYCESLQCGFVASLNAKLAFDWDVSYFQDLLGLTVDQLWQSYKEKYGM